MSEILDAIFGSRERARLLRFFLQNPDREYDLSEIARKNLFESCKVKRELINLSKIKFVLKRVRKNNTYFVINQEFTFYPELKNLIVKSNIYPQCKSLVKLKKLANLKFAAISGIFINYQKSKADIILVGDGVSRSKLKSLMNSLEAEIGKEINFVLMTGEEFKYRLNMLDKFVLEFLEGPHETLIDKLPGLRKFMINRK